ncbi:MAG: AAA family ATPase [Cyanobacteria bacterium J06648_16]
MSSPLISAQTLPSTADLIDQMRCPSLYPHPVKTPIELVQTHASWIFLTGDYAYKIKKPVNFGFLNYSTLARRKHFVEEELRLNRRTAADLYLEAVTLYQSGDRFSLRGPGQPVEYAVKMRQFPAGNLFSDLIKHDRLTPDLMQELAQQVATLHHQAATSDYIRSFGTAQQIRRAFDENYAQSQPFIGRGQTAEQLSDTQAYTDRVFASWGNRFQSRIDQHKIRECHGDLHLGNICWWQDRVYLFDCIEFNEAFRFVDTMYDVAFVLMDCEARGRPDLGNLFLNTYLEETGDWEGVYLLPLYLSRQAYVRAKVTSFQLDDADTPAAQQQIQNKAQNYYHLAWQYTRSKPGRLILMSGLSGSGKSTVARQLAQQIGAIHIRSDAVRKHLAGIPLLQRGDACLYTPEMTQRTYHRLLTLGLALAQDGQTVILDAKYDRLAHRQAVLTQAKSAGIPVTIVVCEAPISVLRDRLQQRTGDVADATADLLADQSACYESLAAEERAAAIYIDTTQSVDLSQYSTLLET